MSHQHCKLYCDFPALLVEGDTRCPFVHYQVQTRIEPPTLRELAEQLPHIKESKVPGTDSNPQRWGTSDSKPTTRPLMSLSDIYQFLIGTLKHSNTSIWTLLTYLNNCCCVENKMQNYTSIQCWVKSDIFNQTTVHVSEVSLNISISAHIHETHLLPALAKKRGAWNR